MGEKTIKYEDEIIMKTFQKEISDKLGEEVWSELTKDIGVPDINNEAKCGCRTMYDFMNRFNSIIDKEKAKIILSNVRHGLKPSQCAWAREKFLECNDLDNFNKLNIEEQIADFTKFNDNGELFYGQPITDEVLEFIKENPAMLAGVREGNKMYLMAFPANMDAFLKETDKRMKRYHVCHCPFAKESILTDKPVSSTLCYCSFGHVKNFWEAVFDRELDGEVISSVLNGDMLCKYVVYLPDDIMNMYVK